MRIERARLPRAADAPAIVSQARNLVPARASVAAAVAEIVSRVREGGDGALRALRAQFDGVRDPGGPLLAERDELQSGLHALDAETADALRVAAANVEAVARAALGSDREVRLEQGQRVLLREVPVGRAGIYVPGGRAAYPSTVVMGTLTARVAGVQEVLVCSPPGPDGEVHPAVLGACALCGVDRLLRAGGAHAVAAMAYGTETVPRVDVIAGPGNLYVQEAKRQVSGDVGIDGLHGPSELLVLVDGQVEARLLELVAVDLLAQAEHGTDSLVMAVSERGAVLKALAERLRAQVDGAAGAGNRDARHGPALLVEVPDLQTGLALSEAFAPEHLQLVGAGAEALAGQVRSAGCVFVGAHSGTAFGDYVAGSNHVLPTAGAARFASGLSVRHFRRAMAQVELGDAAGALAGPGAALARVEGFAGHAASMEARTRAVRENRRS